MKFHEKLLVTVLVTMFSLMSVLPALEIIKQIKEVF